MKSEVETQELPDSKDNYSKTGIKFMDHEELMRQYRGQDPVISPRSQKDRNPRNTSQHESQRQRKRKSVTKRADFLQKIYDQSKNLNFQNQEVKRVFLMADQLNKSRKQNSNHDQSSMERNYNDQNSDVAQVSIKDKANQYSQAFSINQVQSIFNEQNIKTQ